MHRRRFISTASGLIIAGGITPRAFADSKELVMPSKACRATRRLTVGPFLTPDSPLRSDIREDRAGAPIRLKLKILHQLWCTPIEGAMVDVWQADANGLYSGVDVLQIDHQTLQLTDRSINMRGATFLRGHQVSDANGDVEFTTIFPGWYAGRLPHFHVRTIIGGIEWTAHDTQLFFPADVERAIYETAPYTDRGPTPERSVKRDLVVKGDKKIVKEMTVALERDGDGYKGAFEIALEGL